jgi:hypothetical protein
LKCFGRICSFFCPKICYFLFMIPRSKGHVFHACMKNMTLGPTKHEKVARTGRISNVLGVREHKVHSNP